MPTSFKNVNPDPCKKKNQCGALHIIQIFPLTYSRARYLFSRARPLLLLHCHSALFIIASFLFQPMIQIFFSKFSVANDMLIPSSYRKDQKSSSQSPGEGIPNQKGELSFSFQFLILFTLNTNKYYSLNQCKPFK